ncbi:hypothetical protein KKF55_00040 [Patescibacteria group bacterium]|nr:hypothetical protein [Patescibacteria group bacterium]
MLALIIIVTLAAITLLYMGWSLKNSKQKLSPSVQKKILALWSAMEKLDDPMRKLMEADSIFDRSLKELGYEGSLGEKLKAAGHRIPNLNAVWSAHKLRNRLAHESGSYVNDSDVKDALRAFKKAINSFS